MSGLPAVAVPTVPTYVGTRGVLVQGIESSTLLQYSRTYTALGSATQTIYYLPTYLPTYVHMYLDSSPMVAVYGVDKQKNRFARDLLIHSRRIATPHPPTLHFPLRCGGWMPRLWTYVEHSGVGRAQNRVE